MGVNESNKYFDEYFKSLSDYCDTVWYGTNPSKKTIVITQAVGIMFKDVGGNISVWNFKEEDLDSIEKLVLNGHEFVENK